MLVSSKELRWPYYIPGGYCKGATIKGPNQRIRSVDFAVFFRHTGVTQRYHRCFFFLLSRWLHVVCKERAQEPRNALQVHGCTLSEVLELRKAVRPIPSLKCLIVPTALR